MKIVDKIWATFCNMKYKGFVFSLLVNRYQKLDRNVNIFLALASSGSIAAWAIWKDNPLLWSSIIATSQVVTTIKPFFPYYKIIKELNSRCYKMDLLNIEYERFWNKILRGKLTEDTIEKANLRMKNFLKTYYGIDSTNT
jgi:hypothetical protein